MNCRKEPIECRLIKSAVESRRVTPMATNPLPAQLAAQAEFIVNNLQQTDYQYDEIIDPAAGVYDCDCSAFVDFILEGLAPNHYAMIPAVEPLPRAFEYYDFFAGLTPESTGGWHKIDLLKDTRRGDIIAWRFPEIEPGHDTGHVVFVAETPSQDSSSIFSIRVYDSADQPHFDDTRGPGPDQFPNGVGSGFLKFLVDGAGRPVAFQFAPSDGFTTLPIAIGRVEPLT
jgi:hypothetical protein